MTESAENPILEHLRALRTGQDDIKRALNDPNRSRKLPGRTRRWPAP